MTHLNGYYMDGSRLALVRSFNEGISALYFDSLDKGVVRQTHAYAGAFKPITFAQAEVTGLNHADLYVDQVRRGQFVRHLMEEPKLALLMVDSSEYRPDMRKESVWPKGVGTLPEAENVHRCRIWFRASFGYFDSEQDEERTYSTDYASICPPRSLIDSFNVRTYRAWVKAELAKKRAALVEHVNGEVAKMKATLA
jgi:hypothetical protein